MYCPHCAAPLEPNQTYCSTCGQGFAQPNDPPAAPQGQGWQQPQQQQQPPQYQQPQQQYPQQPQYQQQPYQQPPYQQPPYQPMAAMATPPSVTLAGNLLLAAMGVGLLSTIYYAIRFSNMGSGRMFPFAQSLLFAAVWGVLVMFLWKGQNWARFATALFIGYSILMLLLSLSRLFVFMRSGGTSSYLISFAISVAAGGVRAYAAFLLFQPEANAYFKSR